MKRRHFIQAAASSTIPVLVNGMSVSSIRKSSVFNFINNDSDRVLVLIQLNGGNDGLSTILPIDQYDRLANVRSNILIPESSILKANDSLGFHPTMSGIKSLHDNGKMNIVQSVGYPNQNRSHFRSTDIWTSGSAAEDVYDTGWLGRHFDNQHPGFPENFPNSDFPDPIAISIGYIVSETCQGISSNFGSTVNDPFAETNLSESEDEILDINTCFGREVSFLRTAIKQTNEYSEQISRAANLGSNMVGYPDTNNLAQRLKTVSLLISGGLKTKVYVVSLGGFDTHANQVLDGNPLEGEHSALLSELSEAITAFQNDLVAQGNDKRVISMTFSEFGRQIASNFSLGTDHGTAAPMMIFGSCVNPVVIGDNPEIGEKLEPQEGVPMQYDFRSVYGTVLMDWFDVPEAEVKNLLFEDFQHLPIIQGCEEIDTSTSEPLFTDSIILDHYPNPAQDWLHIQMTVPKGRVRVSIFDTIGHEVRVVCDKTFNKNTHTIPVPLHDLVSGNYFYRVQTKHHVKTKGFVKIQI